MSEKVLGFKENKIGTYVVGRTDCKLVPVVPLKWIESHLEELRKNKFDNIRFMAGYNQAIIDMHFDLIISIAKDAAEKEAKKAEGVL